MASELVRKKEPGRSRGKAEMSMQGLSLLTRKAGMRSDPREVTLGPRNSYPSDLRMQSMPNYLASVFFFFFCLAHSNQPY